MRRTPGASDLIRDGTFTEYAILHGTQNGAPTHSSFPYAKNHFMPTFTKKNGTSGGGEAWQWDKTPDLVQTFRPSQFIPGFFKKEYLENYLFSSLNDHCKRKETPKNGYLDSSKLI